MTTDICTFVQECIHCTSTTGGKKVPRPLGEPLHGTKSNDLLQFDYLELGRTNSGEKYVLLMRDDFSGYFWLNPFMSLNADNASDEIIEWATTFTPPGGLMADGPTHFKNETGRKVAKGLRAPHHFTLPYSPRSNGGVEQLGREVFRAFRAILPELKMDHKEWPDIVGEVQSALNCAPSVQRGGHAPVTIFTGMEASNPVSTFKRQTTSTVNNIDLAKEEIKKNIAGVKTAVDDLHPIVQTCLHTQRQKAREQAS